MHKNDWKLTVIKETAIASTHFIALCKVTPSIYKYRRNTLK